MNREQVSKDLQRWWRGEMPSAERAAFEALVNSDAFPKNTFSIFFAMASLGAFGPRVT